MIRKNLTLYILSMLMILTSSGLAADWVDMGRVDFIVHLSDKDYEIRRLRIALSKAEEERDILKKAVKFFSQTG